MRRRGEIIGKLRAGKIRRGIREMREVEGGGGVDKRIRQYRSLDWIWREIKG
jgi:hypothetical protein